MSSEAALREKVRSTLGPFGIFHRIENRVDGGGTLGTPDVSYAARLPATGSTGSGWIELKYEPAWPRRGVFSFAGTDRDRLRAQVDFAIAWTRAGGRSWCLAQIGRGYWLFDADGFNAAAFGGLDGAAVRRVAICGHHTRFPWSSILRAIAR